MSPDGEAPEVATRVSDASHVTLRWARALPLRLQALLVLLLVIGGGAVFWIAKGPSTVEVVGAGAAPSGRLERSRGLYYPTAGQWATLTVEPVQRRVFRSEHVTEGKIAVDEDRSTPIFSPY